MSNANHCPDRDAAMLAIATAIRHCIEQAATDNSVGLDVAIASAHAQVMAMMLDHLGANNVLIALMRSAENVGAIYEFQAHGDLSKMPARGRA